MKPLTEIQKYLSESKEMLQAKYQISELGIFGSPLNTGQANGDEVNLLIDYTDPPSLLDLANLELALSEQLGVKVHILTKNGLKGPRRERILQEVVYL